MEMLQVARLAPMVLGESTALVADFLVSQQNQDGGFKDREGRSDLYYTVFGLEGLAALRLEPRGSRVRAYLESFCEGDALDLVHLSCLARCWGCLTTGGPASERRDWAQRVAGRIEEFRSRDGGYHGTRNAATGSAYGAFLAVTAYQDLGLCVPEVERLVASLDALRTGDGAWTNSREAPGAVGATNATAGVIAALRALGASFPVATVRDWLLAQWHPQGGFRAAPGAPLPDLLSTATALHALALCGWDPAPWREACLDFIDSLWTNTGGFHGHWADDFVDCEYTFYGLLALGHLSL